MSEKQIIIKVGDTNFDKIGNRLYHPNFKNKSIRFHNFKQWVWNNEFWRVPKTNEDLTELVKAWRAARSGNLAKPYDKLGPLTIREWAAKLGHPTDNDILQRLESISNAAKIEDSAPAETDTPEREQTVSEKRQGFDDDPDIQHWATDENEGIASKVAKTQQTFKSQLFKALQIMRYAPDGRVIPYRADPNNKSPPFKVNPEYLKAPRMTAKQFLKFGDKYSNKDKINYIKSLMRDQVYWWSKNPDAYDPVQKRKGKDKLWIDGEAQYYSFVMPVRHFMAFAGVPVAKTSNKKDALAAHTRGHATHGDVRASEDELKKFVNCLRDKAQEDNDDNLLMFGLMGIETGSRFTELLTIKTKDITKKEVTVKDKKGQEKPGRIYVVGIFNRKIAHIFSSEEEAQKKAMHYAYIWSPELNDLIEKRLDSAEELLIGSTDTNNPYNFIQPQTLNARSDELVKERTANVSRKLGEPLKQCYEAAELIPKSPQIIKDGKKVNEYESGLDESSYFFRKPYHALRHIFAQFYLKASKWNYGEVAQKGHWKTVQELKDSYGKPPVDDVIDQDFATAKAAAALMGEELEVTRSSFTALDTENIKKEDEYEKAEKAADLIEKKDKDAEKAKKADSIQLDTTGLERTEDGKIYTMTDEEIIEGVEDEKL